MAIDTDKVCIAAMLCLLSPMRGTGECTAEGMMVRAGIPKSFASTPEHQHSFDAEHSALEQRFPESLRQENKEDQRKHFNEVSKLIPEAKTADILCLIGCRKDETFKNQNGRRGGSTLHQNCCNDRKRRLQKKAQSNLNIDAPFSIAIDAGSLSPVSALTESSSAESFSSVDTVSQLSFRAAPSLRLAPTVLTASTETTESSSDLDELDHLPELSAVTDERDKSIAKCFSKEKDTRRSSKEAQDARRWEQRRRDIRTAAHKVGSVLHEIVKSERLALEKFKDASRCAVATNKFFGFRDLVSGDQLIHAVKNDNAGRSPPRAGNPGTACDEDVECLSDLVFSMSAMEQNNAGERMNRSQIVAMTGSIVNQKLEDEGKSIMDSWQFFNRIQKINSIRQDVCQAEERESRRILWLTIQNAKKHHKRWEETLVELGFARWPLSIKEKRENGNVVFKPNQLRRIIIFDEMKVSLDGSSDENAGGRPSCVHTADSVNEAGAPAHKDGDTATLMLGAMGLEAVPPLVIHPSRAKASENHRIPIKNIESLHQIRAQHGFPSPHCHDCMFAVSPKGGMNSKIFEECILNHVLPLIPDLADVEGKRVMMKADLGPGRTAISFLSRSCVSGACFFPGMPNSTEIMQEMDQLFGGFKTALHANGDALCDARVRGGGLSATLSQSDFGHLIFGGRASVPMNQGAPSVAQLVNSFETCLSKEHLQRGHEKCGCHPATRAAMRNEKMRFEIVEAGLDVDPDSELDADELASMESLQWFEDVNHQAVERLTMKGCKLAKQARRFVNRITQQQFAAREALRTEPGTQERQDALAVAKHSGDFFHIDGGVLTTADMIIGKERRLMAAEVDRLKKVKKECVAAAKVGESHAALIAAEKEKWTKKDCILAIRRHHGINQVPDGEKRLVAMKADAAKQIFDRKCDGHDPIEIPTWTDAMEENLLRLERGEINSVQETSVHGRAVRKNEDHLVMRLEAVSESTRANAFTRLGEGSDQNSRNQLADTSKGTLAVENENEDENVEDENEDDVREENLETTEEENEEDMMPADASNEEDMVSADALRDLEAKREELRMKMESSAAEEEHERMPKAVEKHLEEGLIRILNDEQPIMDHLNALLLSKGVEPPKNPRRAQLVRLWERSKGKSDWKRTVHFSEEDQKELDSIERKFPPKQPISG